MAATMQEDYVVKKDVDGGVGSRYLARAVQVRAAAVLGRESNKGELLVARSGICLLNG